MPVEGERRVVTMLFCDVVGSTAMAETLDPEDWTEIMNGAFERMTAPIERYEGTLARLMGDAIFAFFGAPTAHEDDPERAVAAGLEIIEGVAPYREELRGRGLDLNVRVGINTGAVVVGQVGSEVRVEYTAMGDAVNVAARMEQTAEPGTVQITAETHRLVAERFEVEPRGEIPVKGKAEPVTAYRVLGTTGPTAHAFPASPLVGRHHEMDMLRSAVDDALDGRGQLIFLIGDAGLGKTRLIEETRTYWATRRPQGSRIGGDIRRMWETWRCASYDTARPYAQYRRMLARLAGIADTDPPDLVRVKLARTVEPEAAQWLEPHMRVWRSLFGVPEPGEEPLEGEAFRSAIMELVPASTRQFGSEPRLMIFEDLHWCDEASMDLLIETAKVVEDQPSLFLFAFRPDRHAPSWRLKQWVETELPHRSADIRLGPLPDEDAAELIDRLLPQGDGAVRDRILERTEGNPLFLHEMTAAVAGVGRPTDEEAIPVTLQALITARLDTLDQETRRTLQLASVIGRSFSEPILGVVAGDGLELRARLSTLERLGLIAEIARTPEREFAFHHSLTQDATYATILKRDRRELHGKVAEALERLSADRLDEVAALLARHFEEAGDDERTLRYATAAGDQAARLYANAEAVTHYRVAIAAAGRLGEAKEPLHHLFPNLGRSLELSGRFHEAAETYEAMRALASETGGRAAELGAAMALTTLYATPTPMFDAAQGRAAIQDTIDLARQLGERGAESKALWNLMNLDAFGGGDQGEAVRAGQRSLAIARELGDRRQMAFALDDLWRPYAALGDLAAARASLEEARAIWRELGNLPMLSGNLASASSVARFAGDDDEALALAEEGGAVAAGIDNLWGRAYALMNRYDIEMDRGQIGLAMAGMREAIELAEQSGFLAPQATARSTLALAYAYLGDLERARGLVDVALDVATERLPPAISWVRRAKAELHLMTGELDEAQATVDATDVELGPEPLRSMTAAQVPLLRGRIALAEGDPAGAIAAADEVLERRERLGIGQFAADALLLRGRALAAAGKVQEAASALRQARAEAERLERRLLLWEVLAELARAISDRAEAEQLRTEARELVREVAASVDDEELRASFLARADVCDLL
jgi:class 3 adenylate cyclase/tetratricopeptide (TPR) repeat protein